MANIEYKDMNEEDARKYFEKLYQAFKRFINNDKNMYDYNLHFDWSNVENRHIENMFNDFDENECDYYFIDNKNDNEMYTLDMSHDIDDFGYNYVYFMSKYKDIYDNLYCCDMSVYRRYFEYDDIYSSIMFLYDKKEGKVVEILNLEFLNPTINNKKTISHVEDEKILEKIKTYQNKYKNR